MWALTDGNSLKGEELYSRGGEESARESIQLNLDFESKNLETKSYFLPNLRSVNRNQNPFTFYSRDSDSSYHRLSKATLYLEDGRGESEEERKIAEK